MIVCSLRLVGNTLEAIAMNEPNDSSRTIISVANSMLWIFLMIVLAESAIASDGDPVAIRYWPGGCTSLESMWNIHVEIGRAHV